MERLPQAKTSTLTKRATRTTAKPTSRRLLKLRSREYRASYAEASIANRIAHQIRLLREEHKLTQADLAKRIGTRQSAVARLEDPSYGKYSVTTLQKIAAVFDVVFWAEFAPFSAFVRRSEKLTPEALLPRSYGEEAQPDGLLPPQRRDEWVIDTPINVNVNIYIDTSFVGGADRDPHMVTDTNSFGVVLPGPSLRTQIPQLLHFSPVEITDN